MNNEQLKARRKKLKEELLELRNSTYENLYKTLSELYSIEKKLNLSYTMRQLAIENNLHEQTVYRILSWRKASDYIKIKVKNKEITMIKVCRILHRIPIFRHNEAIEYIIKNELTETETDQYISKYEDDKKQLIKDRTYKNQWNISRDIIRYCIKMARCLIAYENIPQNKIEEVLKNLKEHKKKLDKTILKLNEVKITCKT